VLGGRKAGARHSCTCASLAAKENSKQQAVAAKTGRQACLLGPPFWFHPRLNILAILPSEGGRGRAKMNLSQDDIICGGRTDTWEANSLYRRAHYHHTLPAAPPPPHAATEREPPAARLCAAVLGPTGHSGHRPASQLQQARHAALLSKGTVGVLAASLVTLPHAPPPTWGGGSL